MRTVGVWGLGITGRAVVDALAQREIDVVAFDDRPSESVLQWATSMSLTVHTPAASGIDDLLAGVDAVVPAPGLPESHPLFEAALTAGVAIISEFDLAQRWDARPMVAVTATDGKTTVVTMIEQMLNASGIKAIAVGNTDVPLVQAIDDDTFDVFVVEASSFRLGHSQRFAPTVGAWLNFGPDHLDNHASLDRYEACKAAIWAHMDSDATAVANRHDPVVMKHAASLPAHVQVETFGNDANGEHGVENATLFWHNEPLVDEASLSRGLPHDVVNTLAAGAVSLAAGASRDAVKYVAQNFRGLPHRVEFVGEVDGVTFVNDSKATTPHATEAALSGFESVVLIAGGRNKGLDLSGIAGHASRIRHVVAIGDDAAVIVDAFADLVVTSTATSMEQALEVARRVAEPGDTVLLSPACASFDWYDSYRRRGEHFTALVESLVADLSEADTSENMQGQR